MRVSVGATASPPALTWPRVALVRGWTAAAAVGFAFLVAHLAFDVGGPGLDDLAERWVYDGLELLAAAGCLIRAATVRDERAAWAVLGFGILSFSIGDICFDFVYNGTPPSVSICDAFYLAFYPACYAALALLVRSRVTRFERGMWLDGAIAAFAATAVSAAIVLQVVLNESHGSATTVIVDLAYPAADLVLLAIVIFVFVLTGRRPGRAWAAAGLAFGVIAVADSLFMYLNATGGYLEGSLLDALWPGAMLLLAFAAWQPVERHAVKLDGQQIATPLVCGTVALAVLVAEHFHHHNVIADVLAIAAIAAVFVRTAISLADNDRLLRSVRTQSLTDELTGLGNRRRLMVSIERELHRGNPFVFAIYDLNGFKRYNDTFGHPSGDALLVRLASRLAAAAGTSGEAFRLGGDEFCLLVPAAAAETLSVVGAGLAALSEEGESFSITAEMGYVALPDEAGDATSALHLADERLYEQKYNRDQGDTDSHEVLLRVLEEREPGLREHMRLVAELSTAVGVRLGLGGKALEQLRLAAELHDVGKLAVPVAVLQKPGALTEQEWSFIRQHTVVAQRVLSGAPAMREVARIVRATHERWDGNGYADGLAGPAIPLAARIIAVCDAYAAMTADRPYRRALSAADALAELRRCAGTQFDPEVVFTFCRLHDDLVRTSAPPVRAVG
jgi:two-component system, cell cycle response regulator